MSDLPELPDALAAAVAAVGGQPREGQQAMAEAVVEAIESGRHLLVQAGTGTGKSLAYLVPAVLHAVASEQPVVVATATIALQRQLVERDLPRVADALEPLLGRRPTFAILKGRHHYVCTHRLLDTPSDPEADDGLFETAETRAASSLEKEFRRVGTWAAETETGDRDELVPGVPDRVWRAVSVSAHECLGATRCPRAEECFAEAAREAARRADVVVTNHAMLAIDAFSGIPLLPEHDVVVVDEGHELVDRATGAVTDELSGAMVERAARRIRKHVDEQVRAALEDATDALTDALAVTPQGRLTALPDALFDALVAVRDAGHAALTATSGQSKDGAADGGVDAERVRARAAVDEVHEIAGRVVAAGERDVVWVTASERRPPTLHRAPLTVAGLLREALFDKVTVVATSATLSLGGGFDPVARGLGLLEPREDGEPVWRGLDVGSPFDYPRQGILYVARHLPPPGRDGLSEPVLREIADLIHAAGGRTLGLFSSQRAAEQAVAWLRENRPELPVICQGEDATAELVRQFSEDHWVSLFGTLSLWQGVDVPGGSCQLVLIDRIPFPRPDDPLVKARQDAAGAAGFMTVSAAHAALLLAQGSGRLIRSMEDRGVVAVLDSRLATARYAPFLLASLPPFWRTDDPAVARAALERLAAAHDAAAPTGA